MPTRSVVPAATRPRRWLEWYYLGTPAFLLFDLVLGVSIRAAALPSLPARLGYYAFAFGCGVLMRRRPIVAPTVAMAESAMNVLLAMLAILLPISTAYDQILADQPLTAPLLSPGRVLTVGLGGAVYLGAFYVHRLRH